MLLSQNYSFNVFMRMNILSLDIMLRRRLNVSGFFICWHQGKKMLAKTEKKWILSSKGTIHFPVKNGNWFFPFSFFSKRVELRAKMIPPGNDHWYPKSWKQGKFFTKFYHFLWERQKHAGAQFGAFLWDRVASQTLALLRWWTMSLPFV